MKKLIAFAAVAVLAAFTTIAIVNHKSDVGKVYIHKSDAGKIYICHFPGHENPKDWIPREGGFQPRDQETCEDVMGGNYIEIKVSALPAHDPELSG